MSCLCGDCRKCGYSSSRQQEEIENLQQAFYETHTRRMKDPGYRALMAKEQAESEAAYQASEEQLLVNALDRAKAALEKFRKKAR